MVLILKYATNALTTKVKVVISSVAKLKKHHPSQVVHTSEIKHFRRLALSFVRKLQTFSSVPKFCKKKLQSPSVPSSLLLFSLIHLGDTSSVLLPSRFCPLWTLVRNVRPQRGHKKGQKSYFKGISKLSFFSQKKQSKFFVIFRLLSFADRLLSPKKTLYL